MTPDPRQPRQDSIQSYAVELDETDIRILELLDQGYHQAKIARQLGIGSSTVSRRVKRLREEELLRALTPRVNGASRGYEVPATAKNRLERTTAWGQERGPERLSIGIHNVERGFRSVPRDGGASRRDGEVVSGGGLPLHDFVSGLSRAARDRLPGRYQRELPRGGWTGYEFYLDGDLATYRVEVTTQSLRVLPVGGLEVPVSRALEEDYPVRRMEERYLEEVREVVGLWVSAMSVRAQRPLAPGLQDTGFIQKERHYTFNGLQEGEEERVQDVLNRLVAERDVVAKLRADASPPGRESKEIEMNDRAAAEFTAEELVQAAGRGAKAALAFEDLQGEMRRLREEVLEGSEVSGSVEELRGELEELREGQAELARSVTELVGTLRGAMGTSEGSGSGEGSEGLEGSEGGPDGPMYG